MFPTNTTAIKRIRDFITGRIPAPGRASMGLLRWEGGLLGVPVDDFALRQRLLKFINLCLGEGGYNGTVDNDELHATANECSIPMWLLRG